MFHKLLGEASNDLCRVTLQSRENFRAELARDTRRCSRAKTTSEAKHSRSERLEFSVPLYCSGEWKYEFKICPLSTRILNLFVDEAKQKGKTRDFHMYVGPRSDGSSTKNMSFDLKFNRQDTAISFRPEWRSTSKTIFYAVGLVRILVYRTMRRVDR